MTVRKRHSGWFYIEIATKFPDERPMWLAALSAAGPTVAINPRYRMMYQSRDLAAGIVRRLAESWGIPAWVR